MSLKWTDAMKKVRNFLDIVKRFGAVSFLSVAFKESIRRLYSNEMHYVYFYDLNKIDDVENQIPFLTVRAGNVKEIYEFFLNPNKNDHYADIRKKIEIFLFTKARIPVPYIGMADGVPTGK